MDEEERLDTMFRLNVKGTTQFGSALVVMGVVIYNHSRRNSK